MKEHIRQWARLAAIVALPVILAALASLVVDPLYIWGGMECSPAYGTRACYGYPPVGLLLLGVAVAFTAGYLAPTDPTLD